MQLIRRNSFEEWSRPEVWIIRLTITLAISMAPGCDSQGDGLDASIEGFVTSSGTRIRYIVSLPDGDGPFATVMLAPGSGNFPADHRLFRRDGNSSTKGSLSSATTNVGPVSQLAKLSASAWLTARRRFPCLPTI